jgi:UDP-N-acetylmuramoyl-L-alanyl-D-glutamate--2,6-diaminopimelate ligase
MTQRNAVAGSVILDALRAAQLVIGDAPRMPDDVFGVTDDSRAVVAGGVFVAVRGHASDGHVFVSRAIDAGASLVIVEDDATHSVPTLRVRDSRRAAAVAAAVFYGRPSDELRLIGVTGTNGKTTTVHLVRALLCDVGVHAASIGTLGVLVGRDGTPLDGGQGLTTPGPVEMQRVLRALVDAGVRAVALEVSSHALDQSRVEGLAFDVAVFTSFSRDHLDYHGTMSAYFAAKAKLIALLKPDGVAVVNAMEPAWGALPPAPRLLPFETHMQTTVDTAHTPSSSRAIDEIVLRAEHVEFDAAGSRFELQARDGSATGLRLPAQLPLLGDFNVTNATGALAAAWALGASFDALVRALGSMPQVPGRLERLFTAPTVLRDYAHTPDALDRALRAVRPFACTPTGEATRVIVVFGCGGDRDRGKRPEMGAIAERLADVTILTSDNPRTEDPERILDDIEAGMTQGSTARVRIEDRRLAIAHALQTANTHDVILLAGKGHETYQVRGTEKLHFDEAEIVAELTAAMRERT